MNVNEYGIVLQFGVSYNMSSYSSLSIVFTKPDLSILTVTASLGLTQITTTVGVFAPYTWAQYTFKSGDVNQTGNWSARLIYTDTSPAKLISSIANFIVEP